MCLGDLQIQRIWELTKIGNFDEESWLNIFHHLNDLNLANVATVCKRFATLAEKVFKQRHEQNGTLCFNESDWMETRTMSFQKYYYGF